jgi:general secretion pathway protein G
MEGIFKGRVFIGNRRQEMIKTQVSGLRTQDSKGFTLIELMLVVIIIGALVAMVMPRLTGRGEQARVTAAEADIKANIATALKLYELDNGSFPTTEEGLSALFSKSGSAINWNGPYLERKPLDPWGREYQYKCPSEHNTVDYDLYSLGKDGVESADDVKNWQE